jgi:hypothetical protein
MPPYTSANNRPPRQAREERARAFWQAQINEGSARAGADRAKTTKPATSPDEPPPPSPARAPLHLVSDATEDTDPTPPITPAYIPALFLAAASVLRLINTGMPDGRRFSAAPQAKDRAAWRLVQTVVPALTDKAAQEVIDCWLRAKVLETRSYRDPVDRRNHPGLFVTPLEAAAEVS